jgi:transposase
MSGWGVLDMENMIRGLLRPFGLKVGEISVGRFDARVREIVAGRKELEAIVTPLLDVRTAMRLQLVKLQRLELATTRSDNAVRRMMTVPGVGAHFGLTPRRYQSGQTDL